MGLQESGRIFASRTLGHGSELLFLCIWRGLSRVGGGVREGEPMACV